MTQVFAGDTGTEIVLDCGVDVSSATVRQIKARKPDHTAVTWTAVAGDTNTQIKYVTQAGDLEPAGAWSVQAAITLPSWSGLGDVATLTVKAAV
jgi:hypothetical protein